MMVGILAVLLVIFISGIGSVVHGAPYVPIDKKLVKNLLDFGGVSKNDIFYDLGCGDGRVLLSAISEFGAKETIGYEISLWPYFESKFLLWQARINKSTKVYRRDFFKTDLSNADFVYMYLFPELVNKLALKIAKECSAGTKILCPSFQIQLEQHPEFKLLKSEKIGKITAYLYEKI